MASKHDQTNTASPNRVFHEWMNLQNQDLSELLQSLNRSDDDPGKNESLNQLVEKSIQHFEDYANKRTQLGQDRALALYTPVWCTSLENSLLWIGGCRPSMFVRLVYAVCGSEFESQLHEFLNGNQTGKSGTLAELSGSQLTELDNLQRKTIREEEKVMTRLASLHEEIADQPLAMMAKKVSTIGELDDDTSKVLDELEKCLASVLEEADQVRINTLKGVLGILAPKQAVDFLATSKKLHLCVHAWGQKRDEMRRINQD